MNDKLKNYFKEFAVRENDDIKIINDLDKSFKEVSHDCFGSDWYELTKEELEALMNGKVLLIKENGGEYQMFLKKK